MENNNNDDDDISTSQDIDDDNNIFLNLVIVSLTLNMTIQPKLIVGSYILEVYDIFIR